MTTTNADIDLKLLRAATLMDTDPAAAARVAQEILEVRPGHRDATMLLAAAYRSSGDPITALQVATELAGAQPQSAVLQLELGRAANKAGRNAEAAAAFERAVQWQPGLADAWRELSRLHAARGDLLACDVAYAKFEELTPPDQHLGEAIGAVSARRLDAAESLLRRHLASAPEDVEALRLLAQVANQREDFPEAERLLGDCLRLEPGFARARFDLAVMLYMQQKPAPALPLLQRLLVQQPDSFAYRSLRALANTLLGENELAISIFDELLAEQPDNANLWLNYGNALRTAGGGQRAVAAYRKCIELLPGYGEAWFSLANLKTFRFSEADLVAMRAQLAQADLADEDRWHFEFALGKACEDAQNYAESFSHYAQGNALRRSGISFDASLHSAEVDRACRVFSREFFEARRGWGSPAPDPIFIVGLPRSGSTLVEQILASHSQVEGTRELPDIPAIAYEFGARKPRAGELPYPESLAQLSSAQLTALGERFLAQTRAYRLRGVPFFIDKMPNNFMNVGLIQLMLPNARIIDTRRHPLGCGFSNFKQHFQKGLLFTYSLEDIGRFYRDYVRLMTHFDEVLPGRVHRVYYEHLVAAPEQQVRSLLEYCALPFEAACLRFHENRRVVQTASSEQVRRPIFSDGVDQWRHYDQWLGPLEVALTDLIAAYPPAPGSSP